MTSDELDKYKPINFGWFSCCKDEDHSTGCEDDYDYNCVPMSSHTIPYQCELAGIGTNEVCCRSASDSRVGSKDWFWEGCN